MYLKGRSMNFKDHLGAIVTGTVLLSIGAGFVLWANTYLATSADLTNLRAEVKVVKLQTEDALDARIEFVLKEIGRLEAKSRTPVGLSTIEIDYLQNMRREYERLRKLRYGDK